MAGPNRNHLEAALRRKGHADDRAAARHRARAAILRRPSRRRGALSPRLRRRSEISISTVYRTVKLFEDAGIIERHDFGDGRARYETLPEEHHDHLIDLRSGTVIEFRDEEIEKLQERIARKLGYKLVDHRLELYAVPLDKEPLSAMLGDARSNPLLRHCAAGGARACASCCRSISSRSALGGRSTMKVAQLWQRFVCFLIGIRVTVTGAPADERPLLLLSNHNSWLDIPILAGVAPVSFIAKKEVASWPVVGFLARAQRTVFVDRNRRHATGAQADEVAGRLSKGDIMVLFAEGTSSDGNKVLPFRSALVGAAQRAIEDGGAATVQPVAIAYQRMLGLPLGRQHRPLVAWYGGTDLLPHLKRVLSEGGIDVTSCSARRAGLSAGDDRKAVTQEAGEMVRRLVAALNGGRGAGGSRSEQRTAAPSREYRRFRLNGTGDERLRNGKPLKALMTEARRVFIKTYGCQMNVYDSERMAESWRRLDTRRPSAPKTPISSS